MTATPVNSHMPTRAGEYLPDIIDSKQYFVGKLCTIICSDVPPIIKTEKEYYNHFLGVVEKIDEEGILTRHFENNTKHYYFKKNIVAIVEEVVEKAGKEEVKKIKEVFKIPALEVPEVPHMPNLKIPSLSPIGSPESMYCYDNETNVVKKQDFPSVIGHTIVPEFWEKQKVKAEPINPEPISNLDSLKNLTENKE